MSSDIFFHDNMTNANPFFYKQNNNNLLSAPLQDPGQGFPGGLHLSGRRQSRIHFREHHSESGVGGRKRQKIFPTGPAQCYR